VTSFVIPVGYEVSMSGYPVTHRMGNGGRMRCASLSVYAPIILSNHHCNPEPSHPCLLRYSRADKGVGLSAKR
jgi:hypothetical protein